MDEAVYMVWVPYCNWDDPRYGQWMEIDAEGAAAAFVDGKTVRLEDRKPTR